jgi:hypothetical protein
LAMSAERTCHALGICEAFIDRGRPVSPAASLDLL